MITIYITTDPTSTRQSFDTYRCIGVPYTVDTIRTSSHCRQRHARMPTLNVTPKHGSTRRMPVARVRMWLSRRQTVTNAYNGKRRPKTHDNGRSSSSNSIHVPQSGDCMLLASIPYRTPGHAVSVRYSMHIFCLRSGRHGNNYQSIGINGQRQRLLHGNVRLLECTNACFETFRS